jgi:hypothetical protein
MKDQVDTILEMQLRVRNNSFKFPFDFQGSLLGAI